MSDLEKFAGLKTLRLTTLGRKSGQQRIAEVWFVVEDGAVLVQAGPRGQKGWYANVRADPRVQLGLGDLTLAGIAEPLTAPSEQEHVAALFRRKYWAARLARWFGSRIGRGKPVRIQLTAG